MALAAHPGMKRHIRIEKDILCLLRARPGAPLDRFPPLRLPEARDIFSGNFPDTADKQIQAARKNGVHIVTYEDGGYPDRLRDLADPPPVLYVKGRKLPACGTAVAMVGSRKASPYGLNVAGRLARDLASRGVPVVSGLARGIDSAAHRGALEAGGLTYGVLGTGVDVVYPRENRKLFGDMPVSGALITDLPFGTPPQPFRFPVRNRLIAALSEVVVVVEAARDSGSLITAMLASDDLGLPVCAVPGPITSRTSQGCNDLIYDGATPVRDVEDILEFVPGNSAPPGTEPERQDGEPASTPPRDLDPVAWRVLQALAVDAPRGPDELAARLRLESGRLLGHLLELEIRGLASRLPGGLYLKKA